MCFLRCCPSVAQEEEGVGCAFAFRSMLSFIWYVAFFFFFLLKFIINDTTSLTSFLSFFFEKK